MRPSSTSFCTHILLQVIFSCCWEEKKLFSLEAFCEIRYTRHAECDVHGMPNAMSCGEIHAQFSTVGYHTEVAKLCDVMSTSLREETHWKLSVNFKNMSRVLFLPGGKQELN